jgi:hypothetical protein
MESHCVECSRLCVEGGCDLENIGKYEKSVLNEITLDI